MSVDSKIGGPDDGHEKYTGSKDLLELIDNHDKAKADFYETINIATSRPDELDRAQSAIVQKGNVTLSSWRQLIEQFSNDYGLRSDDFTNAIATLWLKDDKERVQLLSDLAPHGKFVVLGNDDIDNVNEIVRETYTLDDKDITGTLVGLYGNFTNMDLIVWEEALKAQAYLEGDNSEGHNIDTAPKTLGRKIGEHAIDVAKLMAGVSLGIIVASFFKKRS